VETKFAFTALFSGKEAVVARAVVGVPGLAIDHQLVAFPTWTQANEFARQLNERFGLSAFESSAIVTDAILAARIDGFRLRQ
jgi:hypothetical protein